MKTLPGYYQSKYYDKYGDTFKELEGFAYKMGKDYVEFNFKNGI